MPRRPRQPRSCPAPGPGQGSGSLALKKSAPALRPVTAAQVRRDFNDPRAVVHYARAAHELGLWASERIMIGRHFTDLDASLLEAGCGAGRVCVALHALGYRNLTAFDFARELVDQAVALAEERRAPIAIHHADATRLTTHPAFAPPPAFAGCLFLFNGLMQIPLRRNRRRALRQLAAVCRPGAPLLFTTHDRNHSPAERASWRLEARLWAEGNQDPRLREYGDRRFSDDCGDTFMHLPDRAEILADLAATGWSHVEDQLRRELARESDAVVAFSDECRFWVARKAERSASGPLA